MYILLPDVHIVQVVDQYHHDPIHITCKRIIYYMLPDVRTVQVLNDYIHV